jgi:hypothetical protein
MAVLTPDEEKNDWTLDTNVLIVANGVRSQAHVAQPVVSVRSKRQAARDLFHCIGRGGRLCWNSSIVQEYVSRGAISLKTSGPPPIPVQNQGSMTWVDAWLAQLSVQHRFYSPKLARLTGSEKDKLARKQFRDSDDHRFLELARSSASKRLATEESHYNRTTIPAIKRILGVICLDYQSARAECHARLPQKRRDKHGYA